jgi:hypothetical protein
MTKDDISLPVVFISYASEELETARRVCSALEDHGIRCWIAPRDIPPGSEYGEAIVDAIKHARVMVLVFSTRANESPMVRREVERALSHKLTIIPLRVEDVAPSKALEFFLSSTQWLDAFPSPTDEDLIRLVDSVRSKLPETGPPPEPAGQSQELRAWGRAIGAMNLLFRRRPVIRRLVLLGLALPVLSPAAWWTASILRNSWQTAAAEKYATQAKEESDHGRYDDAANTINLWIQKSPGNVEAQALRTKVLNAQNGLQAFKRAVDVRSYEESVDALLRLQEVNRSDPNIPGRWAFLENTFSPEFQDDFVAGLEYWDSPETWHGGSGKLGIKGPGGVGWLRDRYYEDFEARFNISFVNLRGAVWIVRGGDSDGYYFQLRGPKGNPANSFACYRYKEGRRTPVLGPIGVGGDLSRPDDQFTIIVRASGPVMENSISIVSAPSEQPRVLGVVKDGSLPRGRFGFGVRDNEWYEVRAFKIVPVRKGQP